MADQDKEQRIIDGHKRLVKEIFTKQTAIPSEEKEIYDLHRQGLINADELSNRLAQLRQRSSDQ